MILTVIFFDVTLRLFFTLALIRPLPSFFINRAQLVVIIFSGLVRLIILLTIIIGIALLALLQQIFKEVALILLLLQLFLMPLAATPELDPAKPSSLHIKRAGIRIVIHELFQLVFLEAQTGEVATRFAFVDKL